MYIKCMIKNNLVVDALKKTLPFQILYTANFQKAFRRKFHKNSIHKDISPDIFSILYFINCNPDITQIELAQILFKGKAHVGKILNEMEKLEYIKREQHGKLIKNIILPKGEKLHNKAFKEFAKMKNIINSNFTTEEINQFIEYLVRYRETLEKIVDVKLK